MSILNRVQPLAQEYQNYHQSVEHLGGEGEREGRNKGQKGERERRVGKKKNRNKAITKTD